MSRKLKNGLYLIKQKCQVKGINAEHYGILDVGNHLNLAPHGFVPVVIHQTPPRIRTDWVSNTGGWDVLGQITDEQFAIARTNKALENDVYDLFGNNCEHFARYVATGKKESRQLQAAVFFAGLLAVLLFIANSRKAA